MVWLWWLQQHLSSCLLLGSQGAPAEPARAWLSSLSYLYSRVAARRQSVLIKIKLKKEEGGRGCQRTGEAC